MKNAIAVETKKTGIGHWRLVVALAVGGLLAGGLTASGSGFNALELKARLKAIGNRGNYVYAWSTSKKEWNDRSWRQFHEATGHDPLLYFLEFRDIGGTWYPRAEYERNRAALAEIVKRNWRERRAVPMVTWHIQNPYVPEQWKECHDAGMRYRFGCKGYPEEHRYVLKEIVENTGSECGFGRIDGRNERGFKNPREWFEWCLRDVAAFCRTLVDDEGRRIPIVWRPFHEMDGNWFWWGPRFAEPRDLAAAFRLFADIMRQELGRENMLMCYSPDRTWKGLGKIGEDGFLTWYPGNDYADLIGWDDYGIGAGNTEQERRQNAQVTLERMRAVSKFARDNDKVCGIWECGVRMWGPNDKDRPGFYRTMRELATSPGVSFAVMTTYNGPCTFPNTAEGKCEMAEFLTAPEAVVDNWERKSSDAAIQLWEGTNYPTRAQMPRVEGVRFSTIKAYEPEKDGFKWLHGVGLAWHGNRLYASYGTNCGRENTAGECCMCRYSEDDGLTWSTPQLIDDGEPSVGLSVSHGVLLSYGGCLYSFMGAFTNGLKQVHTRLSVLAGGDANWQDRGVVVGGGFWPMQPPVKMADGNWIMGGLRCAAGGNRPAVALSDGNDLTHWTLIPIEAGKINECWGEATVDVEGPFVTIVSRPGWKGGPYVAHVATSADFGRTWTPMKPTNLAMVSAKPYTGRLSDGRRYAINSMTADGYAARDSVVIALSRPGEWAYSQAWLVRSRDDFPPSGNGKCMSMSYPAAVERDGKLYVGYSIGNRGGNCNDAELAVIPLQAFRTQASSLSSVCNK